MSEERDPGPEPEADEPLEDEPLEEARGGVGEKVRRALLAGVGAVFLTEEGIRRTVADLKLPKEAMGYLVAQAERTRAEVGRILTREVRRFLNSDAFKAQLAQMLSGLTLEIRAEVRVRPDTRQPEVKSELSVRGPDKPDKPDEPQGAP